MYRHADWPRFRWSGDKIVKLLLEIKRAQGYLLGGMDKLGFDVKDSAFLQTLTEDVLKSSEIEGEILDRDQTRSSIAKKLGIDVGGEIFVERNVEGVVEMTLDATLRFNEPMSKKRLVGWHAALFPTGYSGMRKINVGDYRSDKLGRMQVVSGAIGKEKVHYEAPSAGVLEKEMNLFLDYVNNPSETDPVIRAGIVRLWFVTLHPFDDGNGRIARAVADMFLSRSDDSKYRFYSMSSQIKKERTSYYEILEKTQKGNLDVTKWLEWFLENLLVAIKSSDETINRSLRKAKFWSRNVLINFNDRQRKMLNRIMDDFQGNLTTVKWAKMCKCSQDSAINDLIDKKILKKISSARNTNYTPFT
jgi:Fic family protein